MAHRAPAPLPLATAGLVATNVAVFAAERAGDGLAMCQRFGFVPARPTLGSALTCVFLHDPTTVAHVAGNLLALALFGFIVERALGNARFALLYGLGGIGAAAFHVLAYPGSDVPEVGASGPIFAVMAAAAMLRPRLVGFVAVYAGWNVWQTVTGSAGQVATAAHLGGFTTGALMMGTVFSRQLAAVRGWRRPPRVAREVAAG